MKQLSLLLLGLWTFLGQSQTCNVSEDYSSSAGWTYVQNAGTGHSGSTGSIAITGGALAFQSLRADYLDYRFYKKMPVTLCDSWVAEADFRLTGIGGGTSQRFVATIMAFTQNTSAPFFDEDRNATTNHSLGVIFYDDAAASNVWKFEVRSNYNGTNSILGSITVPNNTSFLGTYEVKLERIAGSYGRLTVSNEAQSFEYSTCFEITDDISNLRYLSHGTFSLGGTNRLISGTVDNVCVRNCYQIQDCCKFVEINGPDYVCNDEFPTYSVPGWTSGISWSITGGVSFTGQSTSQIQITDWNDQTSVTITATLECGCQEIILTKDVEIFNHDASFTVNTTEVNVSGTIYYNPITTSTHTYPAGVVQEWSLYLGTNCTTKTYTGSPLRYSFNTTSANWDGQNNTPYLTVPNCYIIVHRVYDPDGTCEVIESRGIQNSLRPLNTGGQIGGTHFDVYPNPTTSTLRFEGRNFPKGEGKFEVALINSAGQVILKQDFTSCVWDIDMTNLASGAYIYQILQNQQVIQNGAINKH